MLKDGELNIRNDLATARAILQREKSIYFPPILLLEERKRQCYTSVAMQEFSSKYEYRKLLPLAGSDMEKMRWTPTDFQFSTHSLFSGDSFSNVSKNMLLQPSSDSWLTEEKGRLDDLASQ